MGEKVFGRSQGFVCNFPSGKRSNETLGAPRFALAFTPNPTLLRSQQKPSREGWPACSRRRGRIPLSSNAFLLPGPFQHLFEVRSNRSARLTDISPSILFAVGNQTVNYLSLDIEGAEIQVAIAVAQHDHILKIGLKRSGREKNKYSL